MAWPELPNLGGIQSGTAVHGEIKASAPTGSPDPNAGLVVPKSSMEAEWDDNKRAAKSPREDLGTPGGDSHSGLSALNSGITLLGLEEGYGSEDSGHSSLGRSRTVTSESGREFDDPFTNGITISQGSHGKRAYIADHDSIDPKMVAAISKTPESAAKYRPRGDRVTNEISSDNAQAVLPPTACVFVANLCNSVSDQELQGLVERAFSRFGKVYVKIKRDARGMPFAFAQYENVQSSERAIAEGRGLMINGRQCRTERAKVNRSLYLHASDGNAISEKEAREILKGCGDLEKIWSATDTEMEFYRLPQGLWITFAFFQDARDAQAKFKDNATYHLDQYDYHIASRGGLVRASPSPLRAFNRNRSTVYVSNLPSTVNPEQVRGLFTSLGFGVITRLEINSRAIDANTLEVFAIVEFRNERLANLAMASQYSMGGKSLTLCPKSQSRSEAHHPYSQGSPQHRHRQAGDRVTGNNNYLATKALLMGVNPTVVSALFDETYHLSYQEMNQWAVPNLPLPYYGAYGGAVANGNDVVTQNVYSAPSSITNIAGGVQYPSSYSGAYYPVATGGYMFSQIPEGNSSNAQGMSANTGGAPGHQ